VQQLLALHKAAVAITGELELDSLLQQIVDCARELVGCKYAALGVLGDDGYIVRFPTSGISEVDREKIGALPRGHGLLGVMLRAGRTLRISDINRDPRRVGFPLHHPPMTALLGVPIFVGKKLVGDLYLTDKIGAGSALQEFSEEDEWIVQLLAAHAATALTNAQLHAENLRALKVVSRERARAQALLHVTQAINRSVHIDEIMPVILDSAVELLEAAGAAVFILEERKAQGVPGSHTGGRQMVEAAETEETEGYVAARYATGLLELPAEQVQLSITGSVAGRAITSGQTQIIPDVAEEKGVILSRLAGGKTLRSLIVVPLKVSERTLGVVGVYSDRLDAFDQEAVELVEAFGAQASAALHNAQLYEQSERGRQAAELEQQRLRELEQMKDEFLSTAAHELRTPLTSIRMSAGIALEQMQALASAGNLDARLVDLMGLIAEGSQRMHSLVNDLLDLTRLEQGRATLATEELDLREVVEDSVEATRALFESKEQKLTVRLPEAHCTLKGDRRRIEQVLINLLSNAHKYSPPRAQVEIRTFRAGDECQVTVRDTGPGVPANEREAIFERFYRSSLHRNDRTPSTGLGLPIARKVAQMHQGRLWVDAAPGGGSIFTLALPAFQ
jgi:signal transduction histidine kinase